MIKLTQLNGGQFVLNSRLIESIVNIPETKVTITTGKYFLVRETQQEIIRRTILFEHAVQKGLTSVKRKERGPKKEPGAGAKTT